MALDYYDFFALNICLGPKSINMSILVLKLVEARPDRWLLLIYVAGK